MPFEVLPLLQLAAKSTPLGEPAPLLLDPCEDKFVLAFVPPDGWSTRLSVRYAVK